MRVMGVREPFVRVISSEYLVRGQATRRSDHSFFNGGDSAAAAAAVVARRRRRNDGAHHGTDGIFRFDFINKRFVDLCFDDRHITFCFFKGVFCLRISEITQVEE
jgi:hypothetical protein